MIQKTVIFALISAIFCATTPAQAMEAYRRALAKKEEEQKQQISPFVQQQEKPITREPSPFAQNDEPEIQATMAISALSKTESINEFAESAKKAFKLVGNLTNPKLQQEAKQQFFSAYDEQAKKLIKPLLTKMSQIIEYAKAQKEKVNTLSYTDIPAIQQKLALDLTQTKDIQKSVALLHPNRSAYKTCMEIFEKLQITVNETIAALTHKLQQKPVVQPQPVQESLDIRKFFDEYMAVADEDMKIDLIQKEQKLRESFLKSRPKLKDNTNSINFLLNKFIENFNRDHRNVDNPFYINQTRAHRCAIEIMKCINDCFTAQQQFIQSQEEEEGRKTLDYIHYVARHAHIDLTAFDLITLEKIIRQYNTLKEIIKADTIANSIKSTYPGLLDWLDKEFTRAMEAAAQLKLETGNHPFAQKIVEIVNKPEISNEISKKVFSTLKK